MDYMSEYDWWVDPDRAGERADAEAERRLDSPEDDQEEVVSDPLAHWREDFHSDDAIGPVYHNEDGPYCD
jgi:hypothetical protein